MTPAAYFRELVEPEIKEEPTSIRRAYAVCMFAYHFADAVCVHTGPHASRDAELGAIRKAIASLTMNRAFWTVADVANLVKHLELTKPKLPFKLKIEDMHIGHEAAWSDGTPFSDGTPWSDAKKVVCIWDDQKIPIDLRWSLLEAHSAIAYLASRPELG